MTARTINISFGVFVLVMILLSLSGIYGCASAIHAVPTSQPSISHTSNQSITNIDHALTAINILGFLALAVGIGAAVYGAISLDKVVEHIGILVAAVAGSVVGLSLAGIVLLPYAKPVIISCAVLAAVGAGYEIYVKFFAKKTPATTEKTIPVNLGSLTANKGVA